MLTWLVMLLSDEAQIRLGERLYPAGYHEYLCLCHADLDDPDPDATARLDSYCL